MTLDTLLARLPCLVLLGEPGVGKAHELADQATNERVAGNRVLEIHLRDDQTDLAFRDDLLGHPTVVAWTTRSSVFIHYLDGLDEGLPSIEQLATLLPSLLLGPGLENVRPGAK